MDVAKLLSAVALRRTSVTVADQTVIVREPSVLERGDYRDKVKAGSHAEGLSLLVHRCTIHEDGSPVFTAEEAATFTNGGAAALGLLSALIDLMTAEGDAKNV